MTNKIQSIKPQDILSDSESDKLINGVRVRKGTIGAALANAKILSSDTVSEAQKKASLQIIKDLAPALIVLGVYEHVIWKNADIQKILEDAARELKHR